MHQGGRPPEAADSVPVQFGYPLQYVLAAGAVAAGCQAALAAPPVPLPVFLPPPG